MAPWRVLLVEDNETEEMLTCRAISKAEIECSVSVARDGAEACQMLFDSDEPHPNLILLDLHLPKIDGFEVLKRIREEPKTSQVPVVVISTSDDPREIKKTYDLCANSFMPKCFDIEAYEIKLKLLLYYWRGVNQS